MGKKFNYIFIGLCCVIMLVYVFGFTDWAGFAEMVNSVSPFWLVASVLCMVGYWALESLILHRFINKLCPGQPLKLSIHVSMIGQFFNCVTPSASGGQPVQAYYMIKSGLPGSKSTSALISKFMVYQCTLIVYTGILFVLKFSFFKQQVDSFVYLAMVGFAVNLIVMGFLICISVFQAPTKKVIRFVLFLGEKLHIVKHRDILLGKVDSQIADYSIAFRENCKDIKNLLFTVGLSAVQLTLYFLVSVCIYLGFGLPDPQVLNMLAAQSFVLMVSSFVPLPGASGASEGTFVVFFGIFFTGATLNVAMLLWRFVTFYLTLLVGFLFTTRAGVIGKKSEPADHSDNLD